MPPLFAPRPVAVETRRIVTGETAAAPRATNEKQRLTPTKLEQQRQQWQQWQQQGKPPRVSPLPLPGAPRPSPAHLAAVPPHRMSQNSSSSSLYGAGGGGGGGGLTASRRPSLLALDASIPLIPGSYWPPPQQQHTVNAPPPSHTTPFSVSAAPTPRSGSTGAAAVMTPQMPNSRAFDASISGLTESLRSPHSSWRLSSGSGSGSGRNYNSHNIIGTTTTAATASAVPPMFEPLPFLPPASRSASAQDLSALDLAAPIATTPTAGLGYGEEQRRVRFSLSRATAATAAVGPDGLVSSLLPTPTTGEDSFVAVFTNGSSSGLSRRTPLHHQPTGRANASSSFSDRGERAADPSSSPSSSSADGGGLYDATGRGGGGTSPSTTRTVSPQQPSRQVSSPPTPRATTAALTGPPVGPGSAGGGDLRLPCLGISLRREGRRSVITIAPKSGSGSFTNLSAAASTSSTTPSPASGVAAPAFSPHSISPARRLSGGSAIAPSLLATTSASAAATTAALRAGGRVSAAFARYRPQLHPLRSALRTASKYSSADTTTAATTTTSGNSGGHHHRHRRSPTPTAAVWRHSRPMGTEESRAHARRVMRAVLVVLMVIGSIIVIFM